MILRCQCQWHEKVRTWRYVYCLCKLPQVEYSTVIQAVLSVVVYLTLDDYNIDCYDDLLTRR